MSSVPQATPKHIGFEGYPISLPLHISDSPPLANDARHGVEAAASVKGERATVLALLLTVKSNAIMVLWPRTLWPKQWRRHCHKCSLRLDSTKVVCCECHEMICPRCVSQWQFRTTAAWRLALCKPCALLDHPPDDDATAFNFDRVFILAPTQPATTRPRRSSGFWPWRRHSCTT
ncbi:Aste57867_19427 [Aphanomyces stellatus]|uniref:Aste57867_19427 protein n=1 Tax=Aphanomyces stellatus TaxID=120398 RepID=A0A485LCP9_9STRA|nr:hypothetical protein As57867_019363 [Aphanomyces stellatus]VFT96141.1 Aste57867_19427 [Aphanomyces stellatus]